MDLSRLFTPKTAVVAAETFAPDSPGVDALAAFRAAGVQAWPAHPLAQDVLGTPSVAGPHALADTMPGHSGERVDLVTVIGGGPRWAQGVVDVWRDHAHVVWTDAEVDEQAPHLIPGSGGAARGPDFRLGPVAMGGTGNAGLVTAVGSELQRLMETGAPQWRERLDVGNGLHVLPHVLKRWQEADAIDAVYVWVHALDGAAQRAIARLSRIKPVVLGGVPAWLAESLGATHNPCRATAHGPAGNPLAIGWSRLATARLSAALEDALEQHGAGSSGASSLETPALRAELPPHATFGAQPTRWVCLGPSGSARHLGLVLDAAVDAGVSEAWITVDGAVRDRPRDVIAAVETGTLKTDALSAHAARGVFELSGAPTWPDATAKPAAARARTDRQPAVRSKLDTFLAALRIEAGATVHGVNLAHGYRALGIALEPSVVVGSPMGGARAAQGVGFPVVLQRLDERGAPVGDRHVADDMAGLHEGFQAAMDAAPVDPRGVTYVVERAATASSVELSVWRDARFGTRVRVSRSSTSALGTAHRLNLGTLDLERPTVEFLEHLVAALATSQRIAAWRGVITATKRPAIRSSEATLSD